MKSGTMELNCRTSGIKYRRMDEYELGEVIEVASTDEWIFFHVQTYNDSQDIFKIGQEISTRNHNRDFNNYPESLQAKKFREQGFEKIRKSEFPRIPSRESCLFISKDESDANYWGDKLQSRCRNYQILKIKLLEGVFVALNEKVYNNPETAKAAIEEDAYLYFSGEIFDYYDGANNSIDGARIEILFEGTFEVLEIISNKSIQ